MKYQQALAILEELSNKYLFANIGQPDLMLVRDNDEGFTTEIEEKIGRCFQAIDGIGISLQKNGEYALRLYNTDNAVYKGAISKHYGIPERETIFQEISPLQLHSLRIRPLRIGTYVGHLMSDFDGTLGCFVSDSEGRKFVLSNHHVLYNTYASYQDDFIIQPGTSNGGTQDDAIGLFAKALPFSTQEVNRFDAAIAGPLGEEYTPEYLLNGGTQKIKGIGAPMEEMKVYKCGATSGITFGKIVTYPANLRLKIDDIKIGFKDQMFINGCDKEFTEGPAFSRKGDSGSIVIDYESHKAIGLLIGGSDSGLGFATPIEPVMQELGIAIL